MHFRESEKYTKVIDIIWQWRRRRHNDFNSNQFHLLRLPTAALLWVWLNLFSDLTNWQHSISPICEDSGVGLSGDISVVSTIDHTKVEESSNRRLKWRLKLFSYLTNWHKMHSTASHQSKWSGIDQWKASILGSVSACSAFRIKPQMWQNS